MPEDKKLTFLGHLGELRRALTVSALAVLATTILCVTFSDWLDVALRHPIQGVLPPGSDEPVFLSIFDPIFYRLKLGLIGGLVLGSPIVFWQLWWFLSPALYPKERRLALPFIGIASLLFLGGVAFCYFLVLPTAAKFAVGQMTEKTRILLSLQAYLSTSSSFLLIFGLVFETPVLVFLLCWIGVVTPQALGRMRKYVFLGVVVISSVLTPTTDVFNLAIMAVPMYVLFELGLLLARLLGKRRQETATG